MVESNKTSWFAVYTKSRAEKSLCSLLTKGGVECFLPLKKSLKQYSDRKKWVEEPLLRSYLFVHISEKESFRVLNTPGAVRFVCFDSKAASIPDRQIEGLKNILENKAESLEVHEGMPEAGTLMEVNWGPLKGVCGEVVQLRGKTRLMLRFESLGLCVHTELSLRDVKRVG